MKSKSRRSSSDHLYAVILAGGRGTRFWPRSRRLHPKQLMKFGGPRSLLQQTVERLSPLIPPSNVWILTNQLLAHSVASELPEVPLKQIIAEPCPRNTAPAVGLAAELIGARDPDAVLGVFPADHAILKPAGFRKIVWLAAQHARKGEIVVLGVRPRWPETGYGYMEFSEPPMLVRPKALPVTSFREKPTLDVAEEYLAAKRFFWNSGMFFWKASVIRNELRKFLPKTAAVLSEIGKQLSGPKQPGVRRIKRALDSHYSKCENISVDYAVLEKSDRVVGIPCEIGWNDLGSWQAVYDIQARDKAKNVLRSETLLFESTGLYVDVPGKLVGAVGVQDLVIVGTEDALLVVPRARAQDVSRLVAELEKARRHHLL